MIGVGRVICTGSCRILHSFRVCMRFLITNIGGVPGMTRGGTVVGISPPLHLKIHFMDGMYTHILSLFFIVITCDMCLVLVGRYS